CRFVTWPAHIAAKNLCEATLRDALGSQFDELAESTRSFLRTAEYGYTQFPSDLDFSPVKVSLMKAFEVEFRRAIKPFVGYLEQIAIRDVSFRGEISIFTLGAFNKFFRMNQCRPQPRYIERKRYLFGFDACDVPPASLFMSNNGLDGDLFDLVIPDHRGTLWRRPFGMR